MRLLVVNPNTSHAVTEHVVAAARAGAGPGVTVAGVTGRFGARIVTTEAENIVAGHAALDLVASHAGGQDAILLAISFDTGLGALRSVLPIPVIGMTGAALAAAGAGGRGVGMVFFGARSRPLYARVAAENGIVPIAMEAVEIASAEAYLHPAAQDDAALQACRRLQRAGAAAVVICGAAVIGMAARLAPRLDVPVFDGAAAIAACLDPRDALAAAPRVRARGLSETVGLSPALARLLRAPD